jgi:hypothetical protein
MHYYLIRPEVLELTQIPLIGDYSAGLEVWNEQELLLIEFRIVAGYVVPVF